MSKMSNFFAEVFSIARALRILLRKPYRPTREESQRYWDSKMQAEAGLPDE
jgi:hypothetical protein